jgi:hypothetical protein
VRLREKLAEVLNELPWGQPWRRWSLEMAAKVDPSWSVPLYNLGLAAKYKGDWQESLRYNQLAALRRDNDEAIWWNLGIAATALSEWDEARRAWKQAGIPINDGTGEVRMVPTGTGCVRLDRGETVWGERLDPVRLRIGNIPFPDSGHRFGDIVLHDGAPNGTRTTKDGVEYPVFDELELWKSSSHSTFDVRLEFQSETQLLFLENLLRERSFGIEDWSSVDTLCAECSQGSIQEHEHPAALPGRFAMASPTEEELVTVLEAWKSALPGTDFDKIERVYPA